MSASWKELGTFNDTVVQGRSDIGLYYLTIGQINYGTGDNRYGYPIGVFFLKVDNRHANWRAPTFENWNQGYATWYENGANERDGFPYHDDKYYIWDIDGLEYNYTIYFPSTHHDRSDIRTTHIYRDDKGFAAFNNYTLNPTIHFLANGGDHDVDESMWYNNNEDKGAFNMSLGPRTSRNGYTFLGYSSEKDSDTVYSSVHIPWHDMSLYAQWVKTSITLGE